MMLSCHPSENEPVQKEKFHEFMGERFKMDNTGHHWSQFSSQKI